MTHAYQGHIGYMILYYYPELISMAGNAGIIKGNVTFYRIINSDTAFERHGSRIPIRDDLNTVQALKKHLISFLGLKGLSLKYGLGEFEIKIYHMLTETGRKKRQLRCHNWMNSGN